MSSSFNSTAVDLLHQLVTGVACPVVVLDRNGIVVSVNAAHCGLVAQLESALLNEPHANCFVPESATLLGEHDTSALTAMSAATTRETVRLTAGAIVHAQVTRSPVRAADGRTEYLVCTWLQQAATGSSPPPPDEPESRVAALGQLAGLLAHQIRNPLGAISNALALLRRQLPESSADITKEALSIAQEEVWVANRAISDLLEYSRIGPPNRTRTNTRRVIDLALQSEPTPEQPAAIRSEGEHDLFVDERQVADAITKVVRHARENAGSQASITFTSNAIAGSVEIIIEIPTASGQAARPLNPRGPARGKRSNQASAIALGLTTAHALVVNQGGRLESGSEDPPRRFRLSFPSGVS